MGRTLCADRKPRISAGGVFYLGSLRTASPQAYACAELIKQWDFGFSEAARLLYEAGVYLFERSRYTDAEPFYKRAVTIREKAHGAKHPDLAWTLQALAGLYRVQGRYEEAEELYGKAVAIQKQARGPEHPDVASGLNDLAGLYYNQGRYAQAESLFQQALAIREQALGPEHPLVAWTLQNLAGLYSVQDVVPGGRSAV